LCAMSSVVATLLALYHRDRTGEGQAVATSIVNACLLNTSYAWIHADGTPGPWEHVDRDQYGLSPYYRLYEVSDGWVAVAAMTDDHRRALHEVLGAADPVALVGAMGSHTTRDAFKLLDDAGVPVEVVDEEFCRDLFDDPDARARGWVATTSAAGVGTFEDPGLLVDLSATPGVIQRGPCTCGQHTREILHELGFTEAQVDELATARVVLDAPVA